MLTGTVPSSLLFSLLKGQASEVWDCDSTGGEQELLGQGGRQVAGEDVEASSDLSWAPMQQGEGVSLSLWPQTLADIGNVGLASKYGGGD